MRHTKDLSSRGQKREVLFNDGRHSPPQLNTQKTASIRISGLTTKVKEHNVRDKFKHHGNIRSIRMYTIQTRGGEAVEAHVIFSGWQEAETAVIHEVCPKSWPYIDTFN